MAKKLWEVNCRFYSATAYVVAEDLDSARREGDRIDWSDIMDRVNRDLSVVEAGEFIEEPWRDREPYGDSEGQTCSWWGGLTDEEIAERESVEKARREFDAHPKLLEV